MQRYKSQLSFKPFINTLLILAAVFIVANFAQVEAFLQDKFNQYLTYSVCEAPIHYKIGQVDSSFGLSTTNFISATKEAATIWDQSAGKQLFVYDPSDKATLTVNLIYDERSSLNTQINNLEGQVEQKNQSLQTDINSYYQKVTDFKKKLADFDSQVSSLNQQIESWNAKGGAPTEEYQKLTQQQNDLRQEQSSLQSEADSLNQTARKLNLSAENYNLDVGKLNNTISDFNQALNQKPEEGLYDPNNETINIYFDNNHAELIHTLAHEMGHALGLPHNQNPRSIMYPYTSQTITLSSEDITSLNTVCSKRYLNISFPLIIKDFYRHLLNN